MQLGRVRALDHELLIALPFDGKRGAAPSAEHHVGPKPPDRIGRAPEGDLLRERQIGVGVQFVLKVTV